MEQTKKELHGVTILRFVAAFYIFIFHIKMRIPFDFGPTLNQSLTNGSIGMTIFFVLSGFILSYNYYGAEQKDYFKKRIARIYPAYIACGILTLPFLYMTYKDAASTITIVTLFLFALQAWSYQSFFIWNFSGTWSISVEMFFYALFPLLCKTINKDNLLKIMALSYLATALIVPVSLVLSESFTFAVYYATPIYRLPEFIFGMCSGILFKQGKKLNVHVALIALLLLCFASTLKNINSMQINYLTVPAIAIILIYLAGKPISKTIFSSPFIYLGNISYSFYLMQLPILYYLDTYKDSFLRSGGLISWLYLFILNVLMASICYKFIESNSKIRGFVLSRLKPSPARQP